jgi:hypothetical protein
MTYLRHDAEEQTETLDLASAAALMLKRCGQPELEADRRGAVRAMVHGARSLSHALERFAACAAHHAHGMHCSADMNNEVNALNEALADWTFAVRHAAEVQRSCV